MDIASYRGQSEPHPLVTEFANHVTQHLRKTAKRIKDLYVQEPPQLLQYKEITSLVDLVGQFNSKIKSLSRAQYDIYHQIYKDNSCWSGSLDGPSSSKACMVPIIAILSTESLTEMIDHWQYHLIYHVNLAEPDMTKLVTTIKVRLNQYDPMVTKSKLYDGLYRYVEQPTDADIDRSSLLDIVIANMFDDYWESLPSELREYHDTIFIPLEMERRREEMLRICPFMQSATADYFLQSLLQIMQFFYVSHIIKPVVSELLAEVTAYQDYTLLQSLFPRLDSQRLASLVAIDTNTDQYLKFIDLCQKDSVGLTADELVNAALKTLQCAPQSNLSKTLLNNRLSK